MCPQKSPDTPGSASGLPALVARYGPWFSYDGSPRAQIFRRNHSLVHDLDSMMRLMRCEGATGSPELWGGAL